MKLIDGTLIDRLELRRTAMTEPVTAALGLVVVLRFSGAAEAA